jgi:hypothetical protein
MTKLRGLLQSSVECSAAADQEKTIMDMNPLPEKTCIEQTTVPDKFENTENPVRIFSPIKVMVA